MEAIGAEGQVLVVSQQWLTNTTAAGVDPADRRRLDVVVHGASPTGTVLCCDATMVSPLDSDGRPHARADEVDGAVLETARRRKERTYPELLEWGPVRLVVLA